MRMLLLICLSFIACKTKIIKPDAKAKPVANVEKPISKTQKINYDSCKKAIAVIKSNHKKDWAKLDINAKQKIFTDAVVKTIVPAWIGTPWDFNGITETPGQGKIACGYFVTTVLRDAGITNIARIKLAQAASQNIIKAMTTSSHIKMCCNKPLTDFITLVKVNGYGLYVVGLDNHTGFIYNDGKEVYFIHSSVAGTRDVQLEKAATSSVLNNSKYKMVGKISDNEVLLNRWVSL